MSLRRCSGRRHCTHQRRPDSGCRPPVRIRRGCMDPVLAAGAMRVTKPVQGGVAEETTALPDATLRIRVTVAAEGVEGFRTEQLGVQRVVRLSGDAESGPTAPALHPELRARRRAGNTVGDYGNQLAGAVRQQRPLGHCEAAALLLRFDESALE